MVFQSIFFPLVSLVAVTETAKIAGNTIKGTANQSRNTKFKIMLNGKNGQQRQIGIANTPQQADQIAGNFLRANGLLGKSKPININTKGVLKDFKFGKLI